MLRLEDVHTFYGNIEALKGVSVEVEQGQIVTIIGSNGAGKSTLLMTICGSPKAAKGRVIYEGRDITRLATYDIVNLGISQSPEGRRIFPRMTVWENLQMGAVPNQGRWFDQDVEKVFTLFPRLKERIGQRGGTLSGGEQQMLAIGRALLARPKVLLLDEPSLGIAPILVQQIFKAIVEINRTDGLTILLVEQNAYQALEDRPSRLRAGHRPDPDDRHRPRASGQPRDPRGLPRRGPLSMGVLTAFLGTSPAIFIGLTVILVGGAAILTGRAVANNWKPAWQVVASCFGLALADRFLTYALFQGELVNSLGHPRPLPGAHRDGPRVLADRQGRQAGEPVSVALPSDLSVRLHGVERCVISLRRLGEPGECRLSSVCRSTNNPGRAKWPEGDSACGADNL